jgi:imidazolonepropionase-like amidohydrolase
MKDRTRLNPLLGVACLLAAPILAPQGVLAQEGHGDVEGPIVLRADRMLDVESGEMLTDVTVVVEGEHVAAVNPRSTPDGAAVLDLGDVTLLPGFMDAHTHLVGQIGDGDTFTDEVTQGPADAAFKATKYGRITLMAGFTTVRDFGGDITVAMERAREKGTIVSPRIIPSRNALGITGGHCDVTGYAPGVREQNWMDGVADGVDEVLKATRYQIKHGAKVIKTCATAGVLSMEGPVGAQQYSFEELKVMVDEAARHGIKVAAHAHGNDGIKAAVEAGVASIEHGSILDDEAMDLMKERGTYLVPTTFLVETIPLDALPPLVRSKAEEILPQARASLQKAITSGVPIAFGTDAAVYPHGMNAGEFGIYVDLGMSELDALRTATINNADLLDVPDRGVIRAGLLADIIAVPGNPLDDISVTGQVNFVMIGGQVVKHPPMN